MGLEAKTSPAVSPNMKSSSTRFANGLTSHIVLATVMIAGTLAMASGAMAADVRKGGKVAAPIAAGDDQSSEDVFGFTQGSDIAKAGEVGLSFELGGAFGRRDVTFRTLDLKSQIGFGLTDWLAVGPAITLGNRRFVDDSVPVSVNRTEVIGASLEIRMRMLDRRTAPVGLTLTVEPGYGRIDDIGARTHAWVAATKLTFDRGFNNDAFILGGNLIWEPGVEKAQGTASWARSANAGFGVAGAFRLANGVYAGVEARQLWSYDSLGFSKNTGQALFVGPNLIAQINEHITISAAWNAQVSGQAKGDTRTLDLANFERHVGKVKVAIGF
jgi:hypothetical protein